MRRNKQILRLPQRMPIRKRLRISDINRRAPNHALLQRPHQLLGLNDAAPRNIRDKRPLLPQNLKLRAAEQALGLVGQRRGDDEQVEPRGEEVVDVAGEPLLRERAVWVADAGGRVGVVFAGGGGWARVQGVGVDGEAHCCCDAGDLAAYAAVAEDSSGGV